MAEVSKKLDLANRKLGKFIVKFEIYVKLLDIPEKDKNKLISWAVNTALQGFNVGAMTAFEEPEFAKSKTLYNYSLTHKFD